VLEKVDRRDVCNNKERKVWQDMGYFWITSLYKRKL